MGFNTSDGVLSVQTQLINQVSYDWALTNNTRLRFLKYGVPYVLGDDEGPPEWVYYPMEYKHRKSGDGRDVVVVQSRTPKDYVFHICKVLSPTQLMEWVYVVVYVRTMV